MRKAHLLLAILVLSFLGIETPQWLDALVNSFAAFLTSLFSSLGEIAKFFLAFIK